MADKPIIEVEFELRRADEESCVWACSPEGRDIWCRNRGPRDRFAEVLSQWLDEQDRDESAANEFWHAPL